MSLLLAAGDPFESATESRVPVDPERSSELPVAYFFSWLRNLFAVISREAISSRQVFGIATTLMSSGISKLGSFCWTGLAKASKSARARRKMQETEVMKNSLP